MGKSINIMVVEDHDALREVTIEALSQHGHIVRGVDSAEALSEESSLFPIDLMVIDVNLPGEDGISLAARTRKSQPEIGIIMLTVRNLVQDRLSGYQGGADIYLAKPTSTSELCAAVHALSRRIRPDAFIPHAFTLNMFTLTVQGPLARVQLSSQEATTLTAFVRAKEQQLEAWQVIALSGKEVTEASKKALEVQIVRLRKKLQQAGAQGSVFKSIRGQGYKLSLRLMLSTD